MQMMRQTQKENIVTIQAWVDGWASLYDSTGMGGWMGKFI
jgi:hypothetical protein